MPLILFGEIVKNHHSFCQNWIGGNTLDFWVTEIKKQRCRLIFCEWSLFFYWHSCVWRQVVKTVSEKKSCRVRTVFKKKNWKKWSKKTLSRRLTQSIDLNNHYYSPTVKFFRIFSVKSHLFFSHQRQFSPISWLCVLSRRVFMA